MAIWRIFRGKADEQYLQTGIKNPNCQGEGDCGPCPSLCLRISLGLNGNDGTTTELTQSEINTGYGLFELAIIEDTTTNSETVMISVKDDFFNSYILNDYFTIPEEHQVDESIAEALGCSSITQAEFFKDVKASDLTILLVWNSSAKYFSKRIMKEVDRYKSMFEDKKILTCYLNASTEAGGFQEEFLHEIADTIDNNSRAIDIANTAEHLMYFGQYGTALKVLSNNIPDRTSSIEKQRIEIAIGVSLYMSQEYHKAIEHLNSILTDSLSPSIKQIVYAGKSIEQSQGPFNALEYYHNLSINSNLFNRYVSPRILICKFNVQPSAKLERELSRIRFDYPYSSEINYILGKHSSINGNSKDACGFYESGSSGRELGSNQRPSD